MKKAEGIRQVLVGIIAVSMMIFLNGCGGVNDLGIYNTNVAPEQQCTLDIAPFFTVTSFDGEKVSWGAGSLASTTRISIPAGKHTLLLKYQDSAGRGSDMVFTTDDLVAGKNYRLTQERNFLTNTIKVLVIPVDKDYKPPLFH